MREVRPLLKLGVKHLDVELLQRNLSRLGYEIGLNGVTGYFDEYIENAVKKFQQDYNLTVDGTVGHITGSRIDAALP
ncbi:peptidoglycan-binding domain-containing protein [Brunnivagina elsteri]|uniref:peptidoglycan-binding domain-containing protein n=1 Tax=Brunnivagina elsteri TaxID=1247191 RepID=UPI001FE382E0|nr:peptidoglycan-binding domain-containing protein [Calothrix elsteri]